MRAKDAMTQPVISISSQDSILEAVRLMLLHKISGLPAFDEAGNLAGIVTEGDFLRHPDDQRTTPSSQNAASVDNFVLKFRKP